MKTGIIYGCWDLFHIGHLNVLIQASSYCQELYIGIFSDKAIEKYKGRAPVIPQEQRLEIIRYLKFDNCKINAFIINERKVRNINTDYTFVSESLKGKKLAMLDDNYMGKIIYTQDTPNISTSLIRAKIHKEE